VNSLSSIRRLLLGRSLATSNPLRTCESEGIASISFGSAESTVEFMRNGRITGLHVEVSVALATFLVFRRPLRDYPSALRLLLLRRRSLGHEVGFSELGQNHWMLLKKSFQPLETGLDSRRVSNLETHSIRTGGNFLGFSTVSLPFDTTVGISRLLRSSSGNQIRREFA
jgi:hypothetical protein